MDRNGKLLKRARVYFASLFTSFTLLTLVAFLTPAVPGFAVEFYAPQAAERVVSYGYQIFELMADVLATDGWETSMKNMDYQAGEMANWKHAAYFDNHRTVDRRAYFDEWGGMYGADLLYLGGVDTTGYRDVTPDSLHAELYRRRVTDWRDVMKRMLAGNNSALDEISASEQMISAVLSGARHENVGYTQLADEAAYLEAVLDDELLKLNVDIDRRLALESRIALNEQLERSDAVAAYGLAVGGWRPAPGGEY